MLTTWACCFKPAETKKEQDRGRNTTMDQLSQSVFDLQWPQNTNTALTTHTPNSHATAYALDAVFQVK